MATQLHSGSVPDIEAEGVAVGVPVHVQRFGVFGHTASTESEFVAAMDANQLAARTEYRNHRLLIERTIEVFGDDIKAALWLSTPSADLDGKVPMQVAQEVHYSAAELDKIFEPIFIRIEHGIYT